jgi:hypothetical protein
MVMAIDDAAVVNLARLFNEPAGRRYLLREGVDSELVGNLDLLGFSGIANLVSSIKFAKYYELSSNDIILTVLTDSMELYGSRLEEMREASGDYTETDAARHDARYLKGVSTDYLLELRHTDRRRLHNLKYFTWVEQQGRSHEELIDQWHDQDYWVEKQQQVGEIDALIQAFNEMATTS